VIIARAGFFGASPRRLFEMVVCSGEATMSASQTGAFSTLTPPRPLRTRSTVAGRGPRNIGGVGLAHGRLVRDSSLFPKKPNLVF
jgi:hypothetical protein